MESSEQQKIDKSGLSKAQLKKLKAKQKKEAEDAAAKEGGDAPVEADLDDKAPAAKGKKGKKAKGGPGGAARAAIAAKIEEQRLAKLKEEEEIKALERAEEERFAAIEAEKKRVADEKRMKEEAKRRAKEERKQQLIKEGKWETPAQRKRRLEAEARRKALEDAGGVREAPAKHEAKPKKKVVEKTQEAVPEKQESSDEDGNEETAEKRFQEQKNAPKLDKPEESDESCEDWEDAIEDVADKIVEKTKNDMPVVLAAEEESSEEEVKSEMTASTNTTNQSKGKKGKAEEATTNAFDVAADEEAKQARRERQKAMLAERKRKQQMKVKEKKLRCPIICILGHVDTGKTLILDKLRRTNVQAGEAGGITQQIGATYFPPEALSEHLKKIEHREELELEIPGFLVIDTPGHESFTNLRSRGSSLCDMAVLVVDIMHGLEQQTKESIQLLKQKNTPFCIALNKIDRLNQWEVHPHMNTRDTLDKQSLPTKDHFESQFNKTVLAFNELGFNVTSYWNNDSPDDTFSFVPTSAVTGEGLCDLMFNLLKMGQGPQRAILTEKDEFECTVLEVKVIEGHGTTIDVVLVNGLLKVTDTIVVSGLNGPIVTNIRALLTPYPMKEMRVKGEYQHHQKIKGAMGIKISAPGLDHAMAGSSLYRCENEDQIAHAKEEIAGDLIDIMDKYVNKNEEGVVVQASTIGSLEALLEFLYQMKIPVTAVNIGPIHKKDVMKAMKSVSKDNQHHHKKEFATILAFDVRVMPEAQKFADEEGIKVFTANIIYHLFDQFTEYLEKCKEDRKGAEGNKAVFPCILEMVRGACFNSKDPIIIGVDVKEGILRVGTPLCVPDREDLRIGRVSSIELNKKNVNTLRAKDGAAAIKITNDGSVMYGRHFDDSSQIVSYITRDSIDALKQFFRDDMQKEDWQTVLKLKKIFKIV